ncbi:hypothetical protein BOO71_0002146 [Deinococcus marmoris]|uniref:Uncharacterized protein n=1 Tax=Deinococcus marmoris TaxID=249408 RepID=A0A1U7P393_9DEIO|nr:hypothetical protein BOO71_0002146 [Deinococcus marmoris]
MELLFNPDALGFSPVSVPAGGAVDLKLPEIKAVTSLLDGCALSPGFEGATGRYDVAVFQVYSSQVDYLGQVFENGPGNTSQIRLYASGAGQLKGRAECADGEVFIFDTPVRAGWNVLSGQFDAAQNTLRLVKSDSPSTLVFRKGKEEVAIYAVNPEPITLRRGESVKVPVRIFQNGGISGEVTLRTYNGVTVSPGTVRLPDNVGKLSVGTGISGAAARPRLNAALDAAQGAPLRGQALDTVLTLTAEDYAAGLDGDLVIQVLRANGVEVGQLVLKNAKVPVPQLSIEADAVVAPRGLKTPWGLTVYPGGYRGKLRVSVEGLPAGLTLPAQTQQASGPAGITVQFPLDVSTGVPVGNWPVTVVAEQVDDGVTVRRRALITVMPAPVKMRTQPYSIATDDAGRLWYRDRQSMVRQAADGSAQAFSIPTSAASDTSVRTGRDGGIWLLSSPQVRFDPATGSAELKNNPTDGLGSSYGVLFDSQGRGWDRYNLIRRLDYVPGGGPDSGTISTVPGSENDFLMDVDGERAWAYTSAGSGMQLVIIDAQTLKRRALSVPGVNSYLRGFARGSKLWLEGSTPGQLAAFDTATDQVSRYDVVVDGQPVRDFKVLGVDRLGRHWLETGQVDGELYLKEWVLYDPLALRVVTRTPAIFTSGSGESAAVSAGGTLWVRTLDASGLVPYAYAFKP